MAARLIPRALTAAALALALAASRGAAGADFRPALVARLAEGDIDGALRAANEIAEANPPVAHATGLDLLRGDLLERLGRGREAAEAFASILATAPEFAPFARYRLARLQSQLGHPEVAAGLVATVLAESAPSSLLPRATRLFADAVARGGDCRLLGGIARDRLAARERRQRDFVEATCLARAGKTDPAASRLEQILADDVVDGPALESAEMLVSIPGKSDDAGAARLVGRVFFEHRDFARAIVALERALAGASTRDDRFEVGYALARSEFWLGNYAEAAGRFARLAKEAGAPARAADALHQAARCYELLGSRDVAARFYEKSYETSPDGDWAEAALLGALRLEATRGNDELSRRLLGALGEHRNFRSAFARGAVFLAVSTIERGETKSAAEDLALAERSGAASDEEVAYWRARRAELAGDLAAAVEAYSSVLDRRPFHPFALAARRRLGDPSLAIARLVSGERHLARGSQRDLALAARLLAPERPAEAAEARRRLSEALGARPDTAIWIRFRPVPIADWPIWKLPILSPEAKLVALGLWTEAPAAAERSFAGSSAALALSAARLFAALGDARRSIEMTEDLFARRPESVPFEEIDPNLRRLVHPLVAEREIRAAAERRGVDPWLLAALLREESRFDPEARSPAAALGLAQLVLPTAQALAPGLGLPTPTAADLLRPELSIELAAGYLAQLEKRFGGNEAAAVAAYNAGPEQAELWARFCSSSEPVEYLSKISFRETRAYAMRVLESRGAYAALYGR